MINKKLLVLALVAPLLLTACKKEKRPDDMPELYPVSIKVAQEGQPLADANVMLVPMDPANARFAAGGTTDADGVVKAMTYGFAGAPAGNYKITVIKTEYVNHATTREEFEELEKQGLKEEAYRTVDPQYADMSTTPLTAEVQASKSNPTIEVEVGAPIRELVTAN